VIVSLPGEGDPTADLEKLLKLKPIAAGGQKMFFYTEVGGVRTTVDPERNVAMVRAMDAGTLRMTIGMVMNEEGMSGSMDMLVTPKAK
jgi:hypothetical protein